MSRTLTVLFRRDPSRDRQQAQVCFEGYNVLWPDGRPVTVGFDAFCMHGQRLLGLGKHLAGCREKLVEMVYHPLAGLEADITRVPGHRVRRFYMVREGPVCRVYFMNGTPTTITFDLASDETRVLNWLDLPNIEDGGQQWFDLSAMPLETPSYQRARA